MLAIDPPRENTTATRAAVLRHLRARLEPLFTGDTLDALPAWIWSLPTSQLAQCIGMAGAELADELANRLDHETDRRHPSDRYLGLTNELFPYLSNVARGRLAAFAYAAADLKSRRGEVTTDAMLDLGFTRGECGSLALRALDIINQVQSRAPLLEARPGVDAAERLRLAGERAHTNRAFADGNLDFDAAAIGRTIEAPPVLGAVA